MKADSPFFTADVFSTLRTMQLMPTDDNSSKWIQKAQARALSPEIIVNSVCSTDVRNSVNESLVLRHMHRFNSPQESASNRSNLQDYEDNSFRRMTWITRCIYWQWRKNLKTWWQRFRPVLTIVCAGFAQILIFLFMVLNTSSQPRG